MIRTVRLDHTVIMMNRFFRKADIERVGLDIEVINHSSLVKMIQTLVTRYERHKQYRKQNPGWNEKLVD